MRNVPPREGSSSRADGICPIEGVCARAAAYEDERPLLRTGEFQREPV